MSMARFQVTLRPSRLPARAVEMEPVVDHGGQQVVGRRHGVDVAGEMEVDVLAGNDLGLAAARGAALHPEDRAEGGLAQGDHGLFPQEGQGVGQADGRRRFAFAGRRGGHGRHQDELARRLVRPIPAAGIDLGLELAVELQAVGGQAELGRDFAWMGWIAGRGLICHGCEFSWALSVTGNGGAASTDFRGDPPAVQAQDRAGRSPGSGRGRRS